MKRLASFFERLQRHTSPRAKAWGFRGMTSMKWSRDEFTTAESRAEDMVDSLGDRQCEIGDDAAHGDYAWACGDRGLAVACWERAGKVYESLLVDAEAIREDQIFLARNLW